MKTSKISFDHIKTIVPDAIKQKMLLIAELAKDEIINNCNSGEIVISCDDVDTIQGKHVSGFIPFQDGGFCASAFFQNDMDSSYHFTEKQTEYNNEQYKKMIKNFCMDNELEYAVFDYSELSEELQNELHDYERDYFEDALLSFEIFADSADSDSWRSVPDSIVTMRLSINYKDAPYYREKDSEDIKQVILSFDEFIAMPEGEIIEQFKL